MAFTTSDSYVKYVASIRNLKPLSKKEESSLTMRAHGGDIGARNELVKHNLLWALKSARKFQHTAELEDLIQEANLGLLLSVDKYSDIGNKFYTFAKSHINKEIFDFLATKNSTIRIPWNRRRNLDKIRKFKEDFVKKHNRTPSMFEIRDVCGGSELDETISVSLDSPVTEDGLTIIDTIGVNDDEITTSKKTIMSELERLLDKNEIVIISLMFGFVDNIERDIPTISNVLEHEYNISYSNKQISRIIDGALIKLRKSTIFKEML